MLIIQISLHQKLIILLTRLVLLLLDMLKIDNFMFQNR